MPPTTRKTPQDHKAKVTGFTFDADGKTYTLPHPSVALANLPGRALRDAMLGDEGEQLKFGMRCIEAVDADPTALDALYSLPAPDMVDVIGRWMSSTDPSGATLPQS